MFLFVHPLLFLFYTGYLVSFFQTAKRGIKITHYNYTVISSYRKCYVEHNDMLHNYMYQLEFFTYY